jgi:hypothetical protein
LTGIRKKGIEIGLLEFVFRRGRGRSELKYDIEGSGENGEPLANAQQTVNGRQTDRPGSNAADITGKRQRISGEAAITMDDTKRRERAYDGSDRDTCKQAKERKGKNGKTDPDRQGQHH